MRVVIVGGVACGAKTAARLARICPDAEITMLERGPDLSYANCGFPFYVGGDVENLSALTHMPFGVMRDAEYFRNYAMTRALTGYDVIRVDREKKEVTARVKETGEEKVFPYDKLVLATGASPIRPNIPGLVPQPLENIHTLWTLRDAIAIRNSLERNEGVRRVVIVGAGLVGVETAEALKYRGLDVTLIDALESPLWALVGEEGGAMVEKQLRKNGVDFCGGEAVTAFLGEERVRKVVTDKREIDADLVLVSVGVRPNLDLAKEAGLDMGERALRVDECMRTSDPDIYAGGDCVESLDIITGAHVWQPMGSVANRQGRVIADNIAGIRSTFTGVEGTAIVRVFNWTVGKTGLNWDGAVAAGFSPVEIWVSAPDTPGFMARSAPIFIWLLADRTSRRLLGARILGPGRVDKRIDLLAAAIRGKLTIDDLADVDVAYAPPFSTALDPVTHTANAMKNKMDGLMRSMGPLGLKRRAESGDDFLVLDVRTEGERKAMGELPYESLSIPLGELGKRLGELPKGREIAILCKAGSRSWMAYTMLRAAGYEKTSVIEGGMLAWSYETKPV